MTRVERMCTDFSTSCALPHPPRFPCTIHDRRPKTGDGKLVKSTITTTNSDGSTQTVTTVYIAGLYEKQTGDGGQTTERKYYNGVAMRENGTLYFLLRDHASTSLSTSLGSTSITADAGGNKIAEIRYDPFGATRFTENDTPTDYRYTGQLEQAGIGLYYYNARWYDPALGRFVSADTIVPGAGNPMAYDRYAYVSNNPLKYTDPSGHGYCDSQYAISEICSTLDLKMLTHAGDPIVTAGGQEKTRRYGGAEIYTSYETYRDTPGWWNDYKVGVLTTEEFFGLYLLFESGGNSETAQVLATVFAQNLYVGGYNPAVCRVGGICSNAVFNFIASQIDGGSSLLKDPQLVAIQRYNVNHSTNRAAIQGLGSSAVDPNSVVLWDRFNGPSTWGNIKGAQAMYSMLPRDKVSGEILYGAARNTVYYFLPDDFVVMSVNQARYWESLNVDMSLIE